MNRNIIPNFMKISSQKLQKILKKIERRALQNTYYNGGITLLPKECKAIATTKENNRPTTC